MAPRVNTTQVYSYYVNTAATTNTVTVSFDAARWDAGFQQMGKSFQQLARAGRKMARAAGQQPAKPKPKFGDRVKAALEKVAGGPVKDIKEPPKLRTPGGMEILPIGGAAPNAEVTRDEEYTPARKKITLERTVPVKRQKGGREQDVHSGKVMLVRTMSGPDHLTENVSIKSEPSVSGSHVEIPIKDLQKALDDLELPRA